MRKLFSTLVLLGLIFSLTESLLTLPVQASQSSNQKFKELLSKAKVIYQESQTYKSLDSASPLIHSKTKTKNRIIAFSHDLSAQELSDLSKKYGIVFSQEKVRHSRYVVTPQNEQKFTILSQDPLVKGVYNDDTYKITDQTQVWGVGKINATAAWNNTVPVTGNNIVVAVVDTGVQLDHPDLIGSIQPGGYDYANGDSDPSDDFGHGTHVAGIIAATNNSFGVVGVAYNAKILPMKVCKVVNGDAQCDAAAIANAIDDAIAAHVDIINLSLGGPANDLIQTAINNATSTGIIVVAAAGNDGQSGCLYPAAYPNVVCVGAIDSNDQLASFSNYGPDMAVVAPGVNIYSTYLNSTYATMDGTSMATPYYAGAAALVKAKLNEICVSDPTNAACADKRAYTQILLNQITARDLGTPGRDDQFGYGAIDLSPFFSYTQTSYTGAVNPVKIGQTYNQPITFANNNDYAIALSGCTVTSQITNHTQTVPAFTIASLQQGTTTVASTNQNVIYTNFTFPTPIPVNAHSTVPITYSYTLSSAAVYSDTISSSLVCTFDDTATTAVEQFRSTLNSYTTTVALPDTLSHAYFTFAKLKYGQTISTTQLLTPDTLYLKNIDPRRVRLTQLYLYDYTKQGNQGITKTWKSSTSLSIRTNYALPHGRHYKFVVELQDIASGAKYRSAFPFYTR